MSFRARRKDVRMYRVDLQGWLYDVYEKNDKEVSIIVHKLVHLLRRIRRVPTRVNVGAEFSCRGGDVNVSFLIEDPGIVGQPSLL